MTLDSAKLRATIESITDLPTLPVVVAKITSRKNRLVNKQIAIRIDWMMIL